MPVTEQDIVTGLKAGYKTYLQYIHNNYVSIFDTITPETDYSFGLISAPKNFIFGTSYATSSSTMNVFTKLTLDAIIYDLDIRKPKDTKNIINPFLSITSNKLADYRGLTDIGNYDGVPISLSKNVLFVKADSLYAIDDADFVSEFEDLTKVNGTIGYNYKTLYSPLSSYGDDTYFLSSEFPEYCVFNTDFGKLFGQLSTAKLKLGAGLTAFGVLEGSADIARLGFDSLKNCYIDFDFNTYLYATYASPTVASGDYSTLFNVVCKFRTGDPTGIDLVLFQNSAATLKIMTRKSASDTLILKTFVTHSDASSETISSRSFTLNKDSYHVIGVLLDNENDWLEYYVDGYLIDRIAYATGKSPASLLTGNLYIGGNGSANGDGAGASQLIISNCTVYDFGHTTDTIQDITYVNDNKIITKIHNSISRQYQIVP